MGKSLILVAGVVAVATGCGASLSDLRARDICYDQADSRSQARVVDECKGQPFATCPAHDSIMAELQRSQEACK